MATMATPMRSDMRAPTATPSASMHRAKGSSSADGRDPLAVVLRVRPFTLAEVRNGERVPCVTVEGESTVLIAKPTQQQQPQQQYQQQPERYTFSTVLGPTVTQQQLFKRTVAPLLTAFVQGTPALVFAYGVTNAGKTYTVTGPNGDPGVVPRIIDTLFRMLHRHNPEHYQPVPSTRPAVPQLPPPPQTPTARCSVRSMAYSDLEVSQSEFAVSVSSGDSGLSSPSEETAVSELSDEQQFAEQLNGLLDPECNCELSMSYLEVYNDCVYDLTVPRPTNPQQAREQLTIMEDRKTGQTGVAKLKWMIVNNTAEARSVVAQGANNRTSAGTALNSESSRSHAVLTFALVQYPRRGCSGKQTATEVPQLQPVHVSRFMVVDLAGSERAQRTNNTGAQLAQASNINNSLMTFRRCVDALRWNQRNPRTERPVPFRDCKLTRLLHDFFAPGSRPSRAVMIANVSPATADHAETRDVLQFSSLARELLTNATAATIAALAAKALTGAPRDQLVAEVERLRMALQDAEADRATMEVDLRATIVSELMFLSEERDASARAMCAAEIDAVELAGTRKAVAVRAFDDERYAALAGELGAVNEQMAMLMRQCQETTQAAVNARKDAPAREQQLAELQSRNRALVAKLEEKIAEGHRAAKTAEEELQRERTERNVERVEMQATVLQLQAQLREAIAKVTVAPKPNPKPMPVPATPTRTPAQMPIPTPMPQTPAGDDVEFAMQTRTPAPMPIPTPMPQTPAGDDVEFAVQTSPEVVEMAAAPALPPAMHAQSPVAKPATPQQTPTRGGGLGRLLRVFSAKKPSPKRKSKGQHAATPSKKKHKKSEATTTTPQQPTEEKVDENKPMADTQLLTPSVATATPAKPAVVVATAVPAAVMDVVSPATSKSHRKHAKVAVVQPTEEAPAKKKRTRKVVEEVGPVPRTPMRLRSGRKLV